MQLTLFSLLFAMAVPAADVTITKAQFLDGIKAGLSDSFCADKTYFRKCFSTTKEECTKEVAAAQGPCLDKLSTEIPAQLHQPADGQAWGEKTGNCVGSKFEEDQAKKKMKTADCEDASKWK